MEHEYDAVTRAFKTYFLSGANIQPSNKSGIEKHGGANFVVLRTGNKVLAAYKIRRDGSLKTMKVIPKGW